MSQTLWQQWTSLIATHVSQVLGEPVTAVEVVIPPDTTLGDFAVACFKYAKGRGTNPAALAKELVEKLQASNVTGMTFAAAGPYVNVKLASEEVVKDVVASIRAQRDRFGYHDLNEDVAPILIEYANPNTHKEIHLGHLRNFITGRAFVTLSKAAGTPVIPVSFVNDQGSNVAKTLWKMVEKAGYDVYHFSSEHLNELLVSYEDSRRNGRELGRLYAEVSRELENNQITIVGPLNPPSSNEKLALDEELRKLSVEKAKKLEKISFVQARLEDHDPVYESLWKETREWCLRELDEIFLELDINVDKRYLESDFIDRAQVVVDEIFQKNIAKESEGALIIDLEGKKLGVMLVRKSDGNLLYASKDLALAEQKVADYPVCEKFYTVVDTRQSLYFKQLNEVLGRIGYTQTFEALTYEILKLPEGAMSSRKGNIVTFQDLKDDVIRSAFEEVRLRHPDWDSNRLLETAKYLAFAGITFAILKQDSDKILTFDKQQALSFEGATGPYCQYAVTRLNSIIRKAMALGTQQPERDEPENAVVIELAQKHLALKMAQLPGKVEQAAKELRPSVIAQWCLEMAQEVSAFYRDVPVLSAPGVVRERRLELVRAAQIALSNGLHLLGIPTPEEM